jgi:hypothetical protein
MHKYILKVYFYFEGNYFGCYKDSKVSRDLPYCNACNNSNSMTIEYCLQLCKTNNTQYAGLQMG